jgi:hypothetical protein
VRSVGLSDDSIEGRRTRHDQGFYGATQITQVSVNLELDVERMRLDLRKGNLGATYRAWVTWLGRSEAHGIPLFSETSG